jgi:4-hydroxy-4-methyl-2-oxoglutarate aldolase
VFLFIVYFKLVERSSDILVVDANGDQYRAIAGDFVVGMAQTLGIGGLVVDGVIRDIIGVKALNFPVFLRGTTVAASSKAGVGEVNVPISCGGVSVNPGDIIVADADGVVVIPQVIYVIKKYWFCYEPIPLLVIYLFLIP